jgi:hypothetical protein
VRFGRAVIVTLAAGALLTGCGTSDDRDQAREVAARFYAAVAGDRPEEACAQLSGPARSALESQTGRSCRAAITGLDYDGGEIVGAQVFITNAKVDLDSGESAFLSREAKTWKISALACKPEHGKPRDRPFECEVEA